MFDLFKKNDKFYVKKENQEACVDDLEMGEIIFIALKNKTTVKKISSRKIENFTDLKSAYDVYEKVKDKKMKERVLKTISALDHRKLLKKAQEWSENCKAIEISVPQIIECMAKGEHSEKQGGSRSSISVLSPKGYEFI